MKISIRQPLAFSEIGRKDNQEDTLYPNPEHVGLGQRVFLMCDGMGGHEHGEVASQTVAMTMGLALDKAICEDPHKAFEYALSSAYKMLDSIDKSDSGRKMGTTMTCLYLTPQGALMAHIGDSRIYQVRPSWYDANTGRKGIKNVTSDHSLVNDLLKAGELTPEEAQNYPHKNIITRAMQPHQERRANAEINMEYDVQAGDYFFLCCDGVLEQLTDSRLCEILAMSISDKDKMSLIKAECDGKTKDNYTAWLIPIDRVVQDSTCPMAVPSDNVIQAFTDADTPETKESEEIKSQRYEDAVVEIVESKREPLLQHKFENRGIIKIISILSGILVLGIVFGIFKYCSSNSEKDEIDDSNAIKSSKVWEKNIKSTIEKDGIEPASEAKSPDIENESTPE